MAIREAVIGPTVLVVEGKPVIRSSIAASLTEAGFKVLEAQSTGDAWATLEARPDIRVLFADLDVSNEADSLEFTRKVHDRWPFIGLVITSGHVRHLRPKDILAMAAFCLAHFQRIRCCMRSTSQHSGSPLRSAAAKRLQFPRIITPAG